MTKFTVGKEVISHCSKCKLNLAHTIVSMKDTSTIAKVECRTCKTTHAFKDPATKSKKVKKKTGRKSQRKMVSVGELWVEEMAKVSGKPTPYSVRSSFEKGDLIDHKKFGPGIVQELIDDKIEVLFQHDIKLLVHGK
jgi:DNA-directed RNA polymerase subunit M/transcription elongation factor TFIIS